MKNLFLTLLLLISSVSFAQVMHETATNDNGQPFIRMFNNTAFWASCFYKDDYNYFTFVIAPQTYSMWYPVYGFYQWQCR